MRRLFLCLIVFMVLFLSGCAAIKESEFYKHDTHYKTFNHMIYSWWGHENPTEETLKKSQEQGWWGMPVKPAP